MLKVQPNDEFFALFLDFARSRRNNVMTFNLHVCTPMGSCISLPLAITTLAVAISLTGCGGQQSAATADQVAALAVSVPARIRQTDAVNLSQLSALLTVNNRTPEYLTQAADGTWSTTVMVPANARSTVTVEWFENYEGASLRLAEQTQTTYVGATAEMLNLGSAYTTQGVAFDQDSDGFSNLDERVLGTDPLVNSDRPEIASMDLEIAVPEALLSLIGGYAVTASVNGADTPLTNTDRRYSASVSGLAANTTADVNVAIESVVYPGVTLAVAQKSIALSQGSNNAVSIQSGDFDSNDDYDGDGENNLSELVRGRNPSAVADAIISSVSSPPVVDGSLSDPVWRNLFSLEDKRLIDILVLTESGNVPTDGLRSQWAAVADNTHLYVAVRVLDQSIQFDQDPGTTQWWWDDGVELYIDGNNSKQPDYDGVDDLHMGFRYGDSALIEGGNSVPLPPNIVYEFSSVEFGAEIVDGIFVSDFDQDGTIDSGFNLEIGIPLNELGIQSGVPFGINVHYNDDDDGGERDGKYVWVGEFGCDCDYYNPSGFGTAVIGD